MTLKDRQNRRHHLVYDTKEALLADLDIIEARMNFPITGSIHGTPKPGNTQTLRWIDRDELQVSGDGKWVMRKPHPRFLQGINANIAERDFE